MSETPHQRIYRPGLWPVVILQDRYGGVYSGGEWLAVADGGATDDGTRCVTYVEQGAWAGDGEADEFWQRLGDVWWIGKGATPNDALADLQRRCDARDGCLPVKARHGVPLA